MIVLIAWLGIGVLVVAAILLNPKTEILKDDWKHYTTYVLLLLFIVCWPLAIYSRWFGDV